MYKRIAVVLMLVVLAASMYAQNIKVGVLGFENTDSKSKSMVKYLIGGDLEDIFESEADLELLDLKDTEKLVKKEGYTDLAVLGTTEVAGLGEKLGADLLFWGTVSNLSRTDYRVQIKLMSMKTQDMEFLTIEVTTNKKDRQALLKEKLFPLIRNMAGEELNKLWDIPYQQFLSKNFEAAEEGFLRYIEVDPDRADAYYYLTMMNYERKNMEQAEQYALTGKEKFPEDIRFYDFLDAIYKQAGRFDDSITILNQLVEMKNEDSIWLRIGNRYADMEYFDEAIEALNTAIEMNPENNKAHYRLAMILFDEENYEGALPHMQILVDAFPEDEEVTRKLAICYNKTGRLDDAISQYQQVIQDEPENIKAYLNLAGAYREAAVNAQDKGENAKSKEYNTQALNTLNTLQQKDPENYVVYLRKADVNIALDDFASAEKSANKALELNPNQYEAYMILFQVVQKKAYAKYNVLVEKENFISEQERQGKLFGDAMDEKIAEKNVVKKATNDLFRQAMSYLDDAQKNTDKASVLNDIKTKKSNLIPLIDGTTQKN